MEDVIRRFRPRVFLDNGSSHKTPHYLRLIELVRDRGITTILPTDRPRRIELGSVILMVFPKAPENPADENDNSVGIRVQHGTFSVLLSGDAERAERGWWKKKAPDLCAKATVLKLAHLGSNNGTYARWLELVRSQLAVASVGKGNSFGHPGSETLALLEKSRIPLLRTDRDGSIEVERDGRRWRVVGRQIVARGSARSGSRRSGRWSRLSEAPEAGRRNNCGAEPS
jgi:competence protein ComEC